MSNKQNETPKNLYYQKRERKTDSKENVNDWLEFSTKPQTGESIIKRLNIENEEKSPGKYVCMSYICRYSQLSEELIEDIINITKFKTRYSRFYKMPTGKYRSVHQIREDSRIDWKYICQYQKLSESFIERHENDVLWDLIYRFQDVSDDFKIRNIEHYKRELQLSMIKALDDTEHIQ